MVGLYKFVKLMCVLGFSGVLVFVFWIDCEGFIEWVLV